MPGILDRLREGKDRAAFEAERLRHLHRARSELKTLERQLEMQTAALGSQVLALHDAGTLTQPELTAACQPLDTLRESMAGQQAEIERIRQEQPPEAPEPVLFGHLCPRCHIELPPRAAFCPNCGGPAVDVPPPQPTTGPVLRAQAPQGTACINCAAPLAPGARFCGCCGAAAKPPAPPAGVTCAVCGASMPAQVGFCEQCGTPRAAEGPVAEPKPEPLPQVEEPGVPPWIEEPAAPPWAEEPAASPGIEEPAAPPGIEEPAALPGIEEPAVPPSMEEPALQPSTEEPWGEAGVNEPPALGSIDTPPAGPICPICGASIPALASFCPECGTRLGTAPA